MLELIEEHPFTSDDVEKIVVTLQEGNGSLVDFPYRPGLEVPNFNLRFDLALAIVLGAVIPEYFEDKYQNDPEIIRVANELVDVVYDPNMKDLFSANVEIKLKDGTKISKFIGHPKGTLNADPMTREEFLNKYFTNMDYSGMVSRKEAEETLEACEHFEDVKDINDFVAMMR